MKEKKLARFFCEACDTEVVGDSKFCPKCGRFFASVRCPVCDLTGEHFLFEHGCPACGYAMDGSPVDQNMTSRERRRIFQKGDAAEHKKNRKTQNYSDKTNTSTKRRSTDPLPAWVYIMCFVLLCIVLKVLFDFSR